MKRNGYCSSLEATTPNGGDQYTSHSTGAQQGTTNMLSSYLLPALLSALTGIAVYLNTLQNQFCFDDSSAIINNPDLLPSAPWSNLFLNDFWGTPMQQEGSHKSYRPLCILTFRINYMLHGLQPMGYHMVNVILHGIVCYIFVAVTSWTVYKDMKRKWFGLFVAGLSFAVHPIHTEAVSECTHACMSVECVREEGIWDNDEVMIGLG